MTAIAHCHGCGWTAAGTPADVDKAAAKHVCPGHSTATIAEPGAEKDAADDAEAVLP